MVMTIGKLNKMLANLLTMRKLNTIGKQNRALPFEF